MFFEHDQKLQTGVTETSEPVLIIFPFCLVLMRLKVFRVVNLQLLEILNDPPMASGGLPWVVSTGRLKKAKLKVAMEEKDLGCLI